MKNNVAILVLTLCLCSCGGSVPETQDVAALANEGASVLAATKIGELAPAKWPSAISRLDPERVYVAEEGLYVVTWSSFVQERGLFVPRDPDFVPEVGADPSYVAIRNGVYAYRVKG
jgi:hypothetical protein